MPTIVLINKYGAPERKNVKSFQKDELYKKCNLKSSDAFCKRHSWKLKNGYYIHLFAKDVGKPNTLNKFELPPPLDHDTYYGTMCVTLSSSSKVEDVEDLDIPEWERYYEELYGGFEDIHDESDESEDELEDVPHEYKTKGGYLKDGFIVDDDNSDDELEFHSELEEDSYDSED